MNLKTNNFIKSIMFALTLGLVGCSSASKAPIPEIHNEFCHNNELIAIFPEEQIVYRVSVDQPDRVSTQVLGKSVLIVKPNKDLDDDDSSDKKIKVLVFTQSTVAKSDSRTYRFTEDSCKKAKTIYLEE